MEGGGGGPSSAEYVAEEVAEEVVKEVVEEVLEEVVEERRGEKEEEEEEEIFFLNRRAALPTLRAVFNALSTELSLDIDLW